jgi:large subunit ribosomal protein L1
MTSSKRFLLLKELITAKTYSVTQGIALLKQLGTAKFIESVEVHVALHIDPKYANQQLRASISLPYSTGNDLRIAVLSNPEDITSLLKAGASVVGDDDLLDKISAGKFDFDVLLTTPAYMSKIAKLGRILGPKGLMPSPKSGTVTSNLEEAIKEFKKGKFEYRVDKTGIVHVKFGKINLSEQELRENLFTVFSSLEKNKPSGVKGRYFKTLTICSTMSPGINIDLTSFKK